MPSLSAFETLIPRPARIETRGDKRWHPPGRIRILLNNQTDIQMLAERLLSPWMESAGRAATLTLKIDQTFHPASPDPLDETLADQAYRLDLGTKLVLTARASAGLRHGLQTLRQLLEDATDGVTHPEARIDDWPRLAWRGIHMDLAREMEYRPAHLRQVVQHLASLKMNMLHLYIENKFCFPSAPTVAPAGAMTPAQARALCRYAANYGITVIPQIATLGHMEHLLHGPYAELRESPDSAYNLCPTHPGSRPFLAGMIADVADAFRAPFIHVGYDESHSGVCERCRRLGTPADLLAAHLNWLNTEVKSHGARTMIYGDKFLAAESFPFADAVNGGTEEQAASALQSIDRDILITDWHYTAPRSGTVRHLVDQGFEVHAATASNIYWHDAIPYLRGQRWISQSIDQAVADGATGAFNTNWEYYRGQFFDNTWFCQGIAAERAWSAHPHDPVTWSRRFARRFWGDPDDIYGALAGLAETTPTGRRLFFIDNHVFDVEIPSALDSLHPEWRQIVRDHEELGNELIALAHQLQKSARRRRDTLRMLDMPGRIAAYLGIRARQRIAFDNACRNGKRDLALNAIDATMAAAHVVQQRLDAGYKWYGGAVIDRTRLAAHMESLAFFKRIVSRASVQTLRTLTVSRMMQENNHKRGETND